MAFQINGADNPLITFSITTSPLNQRIEAYGSKLRHWCKSFFQDMVSLGLYDPTEHIQVQCLIRRIEINLVAVEWNQHIISRSVNGGHCGRPDTSCFFPENYLENVHLPEIESI